MKKIITLLLILTTVISLAGCDKLFKAANVYTRYDVDADGNEIKVEVMHKHGDKNDIQIERFYHKDGWLEKEISYEDYYSGKIGYVMIFNENGGKKEVDYYQEEGIHLHETYDEQGVLLTTHNYQNGTLQSIDEFYPSGNRSKCTSYTDPSLIYSIFYFADVNDTVVTSQNSRWRDSNGQICDETDTYDISGLRTKAEMKITNEDGSFVAHYVDEYAGNEIFRTTHYDENGNVYDVVNHK